MKNTRTTQQGLAPCIDEFIDALWLEEGLSSNTLAAYRRDLNGLALWLKPRTCELLDADEAALHDYFAARHVQTKATTANLVSIETDIIEVERNSADILAAASEIGAAVAQVKRGVEQISAAAQEASKASDEAATAAKQQAQGSEELAAAIEEISSLADELQSA